MIIGQAPDEGREGGGTIKSYQGAQRSCQGGLRQWRGGGTHRCVSERSPLRAFLEMEPISLSSMKLWREEGVRESPSVSCVGPQFLAALVLEAIGYWNVLNSLPTLGIILGKASPETSFHQDPSL